MSGEVNLGAVPCPCRGAQPGAFHEPPKPTGA